MKAWRLIVTDKASGGAIAVLVSFLLAFQSLIVSAAQATESSRGYAPGGLVICSVMGLGSTSDRSDQHAAGGMCCTLCHSGCCALAGPSMAPIVLRNRAPAFEQPVVTAVDVVSPSPTGLASRPRGPPLSA